MATGTVVAVLALVAAAVGAAGAVQSGRAQKAQAKAQSIINTQQAERERLEAASKEDDFRRDQSRLFAQRRTSLAAAGVEPGEGSPLLVSEDFASEVELQALRIRGGGDLTATRLEQQAALRRRAGQHAANQGFVRGGSLLLSGAGRAFAQGS